MLKYLSHCFTHFGDFHWTIRYLTYSAFLFFFIYFAIIWKH